MVGGGYSFPIFHPSFVSIPQMSFSEFRFSCVAGNPYLVLFEVCEAFYSVFFITFLQLCLPRFTSYFPMLLELRFSLWFTVELYLPPPVVFECSEPHCFNASKPLCFLSCFCLLYLFSNCLFYF